MSNSESAQVLLPSAAQTAQGAGSAIDLGTRDRLLRQSLAISAAAGTSPSLAVRLEASADGATGWRTFGTFTPASEVTAEKLTFIAPEQFVRVAWTLTGTGSPSFTFGVAGAKGIAYANLDDLDTHGMPNGALAAMTPSKRAAALAATTEEIGGALSLRYDLPLQSWGIDLTKACCKITAYELLSVKGFNPDGDDSNVRDRYDDAWKWVTAVANSKLNPVDLIDSTPQEDDDGVVVSSYPSRGW